MFVFLKGFSKLLICGGNNPGIDTCEVINLESSATTCKDLPNFPATFYGAIGGLGFNENPIICGGNHDNNFSNRCYSLENKEWVSAASMNSVRFHAAAAQLQDGKLLVTGGQNDSFLLNSAEMLTEEGWESKIPLLPVNIMYHCMVTVNSTTVMVIGGWSSGKTFYFNFGEESWTEGPELKNYRVWHSCGKIRRNNESQDMSIIVAGGLNGLNGDYIMSSVEILDDGSNEWRTGPELPFGIGESQMVEDQNGGVVLIGGESSLCAVLIGGESSSCIVLNSLYQLPHGGQDAVWTKMEQKMKSARYQHVAFLIPENIVDCS